MSSISDAFKGLKFGGFFGNSDKELSPAACQGTDVTTVPSHSAQC